MAITDLSIKQFAKELAKITLNAAQQGGVAIGRAAGFIDFPVPLNSSMRKTGSRTVSNYYVS